MNTSSSSFDFPYTLSGNLIVNPPRDGFSWSAAILPRGPLYFQIELAKKLLDYGAREVYLWRDPKSVLSEPFPKELPIKFLISIKPVTEPLWLQLVMGACKSEWLLAIADSMEILEPFPPQKLVRNELDKTCLVYIPELKSVKAEEMPYLIVPINRNNTLQFMHLFPQNEFHESLVPMELVGFYRPNTFLQTGGFDPQIQSPYWQKIDWGFRVHLWGESIHHLRGFRLQYLTNPLEEDITPANGYDRFYLKNIAPRFNLDHAYLPASTFFSYLLKSGHSPLRAWRNFHQINKWIKAFRYRFRLDAVGLKQLWREWG